MSARINIRLPDQLLEDVREYAKANGVTVTDVIIQGLQAVLYSEEPKKSECHDKADMPIVETDVLQEAEKISIPEKVVLQPEKQPISSVSYFNPQPKKQAEKPKKQPYQSKSAPKIINPDAPGAAISQAEQPKPDKKPIIKTSSDLSSINLRAAKRPNSRPSHHPSCTCGVCKAHKSAHLTA